MRLDASLGSGQEAHVDEDKGKSYLFPAQTADRMILDADTAGRKADLIVAMRVTEGVVIHSYYYL